MCEAIEYDGSHTKYVWVFVDGKLLLEKLGWDIAGGTVNSGENLSNLNASFPLLLNLLFLLSPPPDLKLIVISKAEVN